MEVLVEEDQNLLMTATVGAYLVVRTVVLLVQALPEAHFWGQVLWDYYQKWRVDISFCLKDLPEFPLYQDI